MKHLIFIDLLFLIPQNCTSAKNLSESILEIDTMTYSIRGFRFTGETTLSLLSNNKFIKKNSYFDCVSVMTTIHVFGKYQQNGNEIQLTPKTVQVVIEDFNDQSKKSTTVLYEKSDRKIKTKYYQVEVNRQHYLLSNELIGDFGGAKKTNDFQELVEHIKNERYWKPYFVAKKEPKQTFTLDDLPQKYQQLLKPLFGKIYKVQLGVFKYPENFDKSALKDFGKIDYIKTKTGLTIILIGRYKTYEEAKLVEKEIKKQGKEAIVVVLQNGKKVPISKMK
jgi:hypothetical protein